LGTVGGAIGWPFAGQRRSRRLQHARPAAGVADTNAASVEVSAVW
jgi:hypothetical protein